MKNCDIYVSVVCVFLHFVLWAVLATFRHPADGKVHIVLASHLCTCVLHRQWCNLHTLKLPQFFYFHGDFHQKRHFAHPEVSLAHPELPFLAKSMKVHIVHISYHICDTSQKDCTCTQECLCVALFINCFDQLQTIPDAFHTINNMYTYFCLRNPQKLKNFNQLNNILFITQS